MYDANEGEERWCGPVCFPIQPQILFG